MFKYGGSVFISRICLVASLAILSAVVQAQGPSGKYIIQFKNEPLYSRHLHPRGKFHLDPSVLAKQQPLVDDDHRRALTFLQSRGLHPKHAFKYLFNGMAVEGVSDQVKWELEGLPFVTKVWPDDIKTVNVDTTSINAGSVWNMTDGQGNPVKGLGVKIAIVDTGIDYTRPDLGGCFGSGCKVVKWVDYIGGRTTPYDDYGHGTHVSGIAAGQGPVVLGVAPAATLYGYKVCDNAGQCFSSNNIAALQQAVADGAQVINMSLGGPGNASDPLSQAVDNAYSAGTVIVVAAGNAGPNLYTIGSPGAAVDAITVAAVDTTVTPYTMAYFSSRGPGPSPVYNIKPDVAGPGVSIYSTVPLTGNTCCSNPSGYMRLSGTSMATPHVTGAAALLIQMHPTWNPGQIKAALVETGGDVKLYATDSQAVYAQGGGLISCPNAINAKSVILPAVLSSGLDNTSLSVWSSSISLTQSDFTGTRNFSLAASINSPTGVTFTLNPSLYQLSVNNGLAIPANNSGYLTASASDQSLRLPLGYSAASASPYPAITSPPTANGTEGIPFTYQIAATNSPTSYGAAGLPGGLWLNTGTGVISGTPNVSGGFSVTINATNASGTGTAPLQITIASAPPNGPLITTFAGTGANGFIGDGGPAASAQLYFPDGTAFDAAGNLYVADSFNNRVRKITPAGIITTVAGNGNFGYSGDGGPATSAALAGPFGVAVDVAGNLYVADTANYRIRKVSTTGTITTFAGTGNPPGLLGDGGPATQANLNYPNGVSVDTVGNVYIADTNDYRIRKVNSAGIITTVAGIGAPGYTGDGGPATAAQIRSPDGVFVDAAGNIYIADTFNDAIRKVNPAGTITTVAGHGPQGYSGDGGPATSALLNNPGAIYADKAGNLYIADSGNDRIRMVDSAGIITTVAGNGTPGYSGDGNPATWAQLNYPQGIALDASGNLYIADYYNSRIRKVGSTTTPPTPSPCDVNGDGTTNVMDVQLEINQALGLAPCTNDIKKDGVCNVLDVVRAINAALTGVCVTP